MVGAGLASSSSARGVASTWSSLERPELGGDGGRFVILEVAGGSFAVEAGLRLCLYNFTFAYCRFCSS